MRAFWLWLLMHMPAIIALAQYPSAQFGFPNEPYNICIGEIVDVQNNSTNASSFLWDFCPETFTESPTLSAPLPINGLVNGWAYKVVKSNGNWFGFLASRNTNKLYRLEFGPDPSTDPVIFDLGNPGGLLVSPQGMEIVNHNGDWYLFVGKGETTTGQIVRLEFGNDLTSTPIPFGLGTFGINGRIRDLRVVKQGSDLILLMINDTGNAIVRANFANSFNNPINAGNITSTGVLPGANLPLGMSIIKVNGAWIVHTVSFLNNGIQQYNFGTDILGPPTLEGNFNFPSVVRPYYIKVIREGKDYFAFVGNESQKLSIINFNDLNIANSPQQLPNSNLKSLINFDVVKFESKNIIQGVERGSTNFIQLSFQNNSCGVSKQWDDKEIPSNLYWSQSGAATIELEVRGDDDLTDNTSKELTISTDLAPIIDINHDNSCVSSFITFSTTSSETLSSWNWDFGDTQTSTAQSPSHHFATADDYDVSLRATASNGCSNLASKTVTIYNEPVASFDLPSTSPICTNQDYLFTNTTSFDSGSDPSWQWEINGTPTSIVKDLTYVIPTATMQDIKLIASIPGCSSEVTKTINTVEDGPLVDFSFSNDCEDKSIVFTNATVGTVTGYSWDFGDGNNSIQTNPSNTFVDFGNYDVRLVASNLAGCMNTATKPIQIYSNPQPDFSLDLPPFSCNGSPSQFNDLTPNPTDSNLDSWTWSFGDPQNGTSIARNPQYVYEDADQYDVSLDVTTNFGCTASIQKIVTISPSPNADFTFNTACVNQPTLFIPLSTTGVDSWQWKIGTSTYNQQSPTHVFGSSSNYNVRLTATGSNGCVAVIDKMINVPIPGNVNFSSVNNCADQNTLFTDLTVSGSDPITSRLWQFGTIGSASDPTPSFKFPLAGAYPTQLTVTDASGCSYSTSKIVNITESPVATFTATPQVGAPPLTVQLKNTTGNSVSQSWSVDGVSTLSSTDVAPSFTFDALGDYAVDLAVEDESGCISETSKIISVIIPELDIELTSLSLVPTSTGESDILLTIKNNSNFPVNNIEAIIDISGEALISETITTTIQPSEVYSHILTTGIVDRKNGYTYLCVELAVDGEADIQNNKKCLNNDATTVVMAPYPNPGSENLNLEWVAPVPGNAEIHIFDPNGRKVYEDILSDLKPGLNQTTIPVSLLHPGMYYLFFVSEGVRKSFPFVIRR